MKTILLALALALASCQSIYHCPRPGLAILQIIQQQEAAWNRGDLEAFMAGYDRSPELSFVAGGNVTKGWQETLDRYKKSYDTKEKMGRLRFEDLKVEAIGNDSALVLGKWIVETQDKEPSWGHFTLLFRKKVEGWRIVLDHTSSASKK